jgi:hypothetical protein
MITRTFLQFAIMVGVLGYGTTTHICPPALKPAIAMPPPRQASSFRGDVLSIRRVLPNDKTIAVGKSQDLAMVVRVTSINDQGAAGFSVGDEVVFAVSSSASCWEFYSGKSVGFSLESINGRFAWLFAFSC